MKGPRSDDVRQVRIRGRAERTEGPAVDRGLSNQALVPFVWKARRHLLRLDRAALG